LTKLKNYAILKIKKKGGKMFFNIFNKTEKNFLIGMSIISLFLVSLGLGDYSKGLIIFAMIFFLGPLIVVFRIALRRQNFDLYDFFSDILRIIRDFVMYGLPALFFLGLIVFGNCTRYADYGDPRIDAAIIKTMIYGIIIGGIGILIYSYIHFRKKLLS